jgi:hypothetical protein
MSQEIGPTRISASAFAGSRSRAPGAAATLAISFDDGTEPTEERYCMNSLSLSLEADERSKFLYLKHGFEATGELRLPKGPSFFPMWRAPARCW